MDVYGLEEDQRGADWEGEGSQDAGTKFSRSWPQILVLATATPIAKGASSRACCLEGSHTTHGTLFLYWFASAQEPCWHTVPTHWFPKGAQAGSPSQEELGVQGRL